METALVGGGIVGVGGGDRPFERLQSFISQEQLRAQSDRYKRVAGNSIEDLAAPGAVPAR